MERIILNNGLLAFTAHACGPSNGPIVLLLHGFPDNPHTFKPQMRALADAGYRAIAPTMRGYEPSSQPADQDYRLGTMARDVLAWVDQLGVPSVHLVGHDWGAAVTYLAGALAPDRFDSLTTMAVPHTPRMAEVAWKIPAQWWNSWYMSFFQLPWIPEWAIERNDWALLKWLSSQWSQSFSLPEEEWANRRKTFETDGVKAAMLAYYRQNVSPGVLLGFIPSEALQMSTVPVRTLAMAGELDGCMDSRLFDKTLLEEDFPAGLRILQIENAGHFLHLDAPTAVNRALLDWIAEEKTPL